MNISSRDRMSFPADLADTRRSGRKIAALLPSFAECGDPGCGYDAVHDTGLDPSCSECAGLGRVTIWVAREFFANVRNVEQVMLTFGSVPQGARVGDTFITFGKRDYEMVRQLLDNKDAYIHLDNGYFRPTFIQAAGIGQVEEYVTVLASYSPTFHAPGH